MFLAYKNKGILVPVFIIVSVFGTLMIAAALQRNYTNIFSTLDVPLVLGMGFLVAALWTYLTKDSYYKNSEGNKVFMDDENSFYFMSMKVWAYILLIIGLVLLSNMLFHFIPN